MESKKLLKVVVVLSMLGVFLRQIWISVANLRAPDIARIFTEEAMAGVPHPSVTVCLNFDVTAKPQRVGEIKEKKLTEIFEGFPSLREKAVAYFKPQKVPLE
jgi:hypothetical protein